ncbi:site-specific DNA-methyltransferase [bacterium]|nr:site-specific DNA-methyltransferase [bacterium]
MRKGTQTSTFGTNGRINHDSTKFYNSKLYQNLEKTEVSISEDTTLPEELENKIFLGSSEKMQKLPSNSIHLMVTSPPYNVSKDYDENLSLDEYLALLRSVFTETYRVLVNGGRACVNIANIGRKPYLPLSDFVSRLMLEIGFKMRGEIIWNKAASSSPSTAWGSWQSASNPILRDVHEYILVFSKGDFKRETNGKINTITKEQFLEWTKSVWVFKAESAKRIGHPAPFPEELPYRLIQLYSFKNDVVLDPFLGSGTSALVSVKTGRKFVGYETNESYVNLSKSRIYAELNQQKLTL